jgi:hypothetical protein
MKTSQATVTAKRDRFPAKRNQKTKAPGAKKPLVKKLSKRAAIKRQIAFAQEHLCGLLTDAKNNLPSYRSADFRKDMDTIKRRIQSEGLPFATLSLPTLIQGLFDLLEGRDATFPGFLVRGDHPVFLRGLFHVVLNGSEAEKVKGFDYLYSIAVGFKKLKGPYPKSVLTKQFSEFVEVDRELESIDLFTEDRYPILQLARQYVKSVIKDISLDSRKCLPRPGPGATNTPLSKEMRYRPHSLFAQIERHLPFMDGWFSSHPWDVVSQSDHYAKLFHSGIKDEPTSRFKFVPKTSGKARGICIEENEVQFLQQAIRRVLTDKILTCPTTKRNLALNDQQVNAHLALTASIAKTFCTIDMSEASDRVSRELVSWLFQDNQELHDALMALSTRWIEPPKEVDWPGSIRTNKFAPMGSALCFPVMTLVHYALIKAIIRLSTVQDRKHKSRQVYVYGDDIVIYNDCYTAVTDWLPRFGMKLNHTKSFHRSHFRESCGIHAYKGRDITPVYVKHIPYQQSHGELFSYLAVEHTLFKKGFAKTAEVHRSWIKRHQGMRMPEVPENSDLIGFKRPISLFHGRVPQIHQGTVAKRKRWNADYQAWDYLVYTLRRGRQDLKLPSEMDAYLKWQVVHSEKSAKIVDALPGFSLKKRWVTESALTTRFTEKTTVNHVPRHPYIWWHTARHIVDWFCDDRGMKPRVGPEQRVQWNCLPFNWKLPRETVDTGSKA